MRFRKLAPGSYAVDSSGETIGQVHKDPLGQGWQAWPPGKNSGPYFATRNEAADYLWRQH